MTIPTTRTHRSAPRHRAATRSRWHPIGVSLALGVLVLAAPPARAQVGSLGIGSRAIAMGNAFTGVADDLSATYYNPAGLTQLIDGGAVASVGLSFNLVDMRYSQPVVDERSQVEPGRTIGARTGAPGAVLLPSLW